MSSDKKVVVCKKTKPELIEDFCKYMRQLSGDLNRRFPNRDVVSTVHRKITIGITHAPERILRAVGTYLVKYSEKIEAKDYDFFLKSTYDSDFPKDREMDEKERLCMFTIELVKQHWNGLNIKEKADYQKITTCLLYCYCDFMELEESAKSSAKT